MPDLLQPEWGASWDGQSLFLAPSLTAGDRLDARKVRFGRSLIDLSASKKPDRIVIRIALRFGPPLRLRLTWGGPETISNVLYGEEEIPVGVVSFLVEREHDVQFLFADS